MYRYCSSECVLVLSVPCILTVLGIAIVIEHVSRKRYNCPPAKVAVVKYEAQNRTAICSLKKYVRKFTDAKSKSKQSTQEEEQAN